jgi:hypothetical protein
VIPVVKMADLYERSCDVSIENIEQLSEEVLALSERCAKEKLSDDDYVIAYTSCLKIMCKFQDMRNARIDVTKGSRHNMIHSLSRMRDWISKDAIGVDPEHVQYTHNLRIRLVEFEPDFRRGQMTKAEVFLWCNLLAMVFQNLTVICETYQGCSQISRILADAGHVSKDINFEQLQNAEFAEKFKGHVPRIMKFVAVKSLASGVEHVPMCIVENGHYEQHIHDVLSMKNPEKYKGRVDDVENNGNMTKHNVYYDTEFEVIYMKKGSMLVPIVPETFATAISRIIKDIGKKAEDSTEVQDAQEIWDRVRADQDGESN